MHAGGHNALFARRLAIAAVASLLLGLLPAAIGGMLAIVAATVGVTFAAIFGLSAWLVARERAVAHRPAGAPGGRVLAEWRYDEATWRAYLDAAWDHTEGAYYRTAGRAGLLVGIALGLVVARLFGPVAGLLVAGVAAGIGPVGDRLHRWLVGFDRPPSAARVTERGWSFDGRTGRWLDGDGDPNVVSVALTDTTPRLLDLLVVRDDGEAWRPVRVLIPVPASQEPSARNIAGRLREMIDEADREAGGADDEPSRAWNPRSRS